MTKRFSVGLLLASLVITPLSGIIGCEQEAETVTPAGTPVEVEEDGDVEVE